MNYRSMTIVVCSFLIAGCMSDRMPKLFVAEHNQNAYNLRVRPCDANMKTFQEKPDYPKDFCYVDFFMIVHNITEHPLYLSEEWNSDGYSSIEIDLRKRDGINYSLRKRAGLWFRNFPSMLIVLPKSMLAYPLSLDEGVWEGLPPIEIGEEVWIRARLRLGHTKIDGEMVRMPQKSIESDWTPVFIKRKRSAHISDVNRCN